MMDGFVVPVFHHGGNANGDRCYVDGQVTRFSAMDVDFVNKGHLLELAKEIGYMKINEMFWQEHARINFDVGLYSLVGDREISEMCEYTLNHKLKEFHIYLDHPVDVPMMPEPDPAKEPVAVESSSSDSYESAEDVRAKCGTLGCPWLIYCSENSVTKSFEIKTFRNEHICGRDMTSNMADKKWVMEKLVKRLKTQPKLTPKEAMKH
ncbi:hypothetical protein PIB30_100165 [Stylosanthes scabra]|uniref:PB1-like domain-containing protein n=1 Tax=Stylosanthes scabra TaxID=79078 RepID=A0ABU6XW41_9FABA|nr:hypothetical protein [Stylosanthes scabra]